MTFKPRIAAGAAALALAVGGLGMAGILSAGASTPPCGDCSDIWSLEFHHDFPLDVYHGQASSGQPVILFQRSNSDPAEDFVVTDLGLVDSVYRHNRNLISTGFSQAFGSDAAFEIEYEPLGVPSHLCVGTTLDEAAYSGEPVALYPCGESPSTVWVLDTADGVSPVAGLRRLHQRRDGQLLQPARADLPGRQPDRHAAPAAERPAAEQFLGRHDLRQPASGTASAARRRHHRPCPPRRPFRPRTTSSFW